MTRIETQLNTFLMKSPTIGKGVYIAQSAVVLGDVTLGDHASVWFNATLRGDINRIVVGAFSNVQDNCVLHLADEYPCIIGNYVTVGHGAIVHACTIKDEVLIGMGATVLDGAVVGEQSLIGAHTLVTPGMEIPPGSMVLGSPAKVVRALSEVERSRLKGWAEKYVHVAEYYLRNGVEVGGPRVPPAPVVV